MSCERIVVLKCDSCGNSPDWGCTMKGTFASIRKMAVDVYSWKCLKNWDICEECK